MARTWLSLRVELLGGGGEDLWPWPGRIFAVGPSHTFMDFAMAVNRAFARWDLSHLSMFTLADGRVVTDEETGAELATSAGGPLIATLDIESVKVARVLEPSQPHPMLMHAWPEHMQVPSLDWSGPSRARAPSVGSATSFTGRTSQNRGMPSPPTDNWV
ncbi:MAG: hypothetical protein ACRDPB_05225, partial [Nocardioidaceae bacterium]